MIPAADKDVVKVFTKRISKKFNLMLETKVTAVEAKEDGIYVSMEGKSSRLKHSVMTRCWSLSVAYRTVKP